MTNSFSTNSIYVSPALSTSDKSTVQSLIMDDLPTYRCAFSDGEDVILKILPRLEILTQNDSEKLSITVTCLKQIVEQGLDFTRLETNLNLLINLAFFNKTVGFKPEDNFPASQISSLTKLIECMGGRQTSDIENADFIIANRAEKSSDEREISPAYVNFKANTDSLISFRDFISPKRSSAKTTHSYSQKMHSQEKPKFYEKKTASVNQITCSQTKKGRSKRVVPDAQSRTIFDCGLSQLSQAPVSSMPEESNQTSPMSSLRSELEKLNESVHPSQETATPSQSTNPSQTTAQSSQTHKSRIDNISNGSSPMTTQSSQSSQAHGVTLSNRISQRKSISFDHSQRENSQNSISLLKSVDGQMRLSQTSETPSQHKKKTKQTQKPEKQKTKQLTLLDKAPRRCGSAPKITSPKKETANAIPIPEDIEIFAPQKITDLKDKPHVSLKKLCDDIITIKSPMRKSSSVADTDCIIDFSQKYSPGMNDDNDNEKIMLTIDENSIKRSQNDDDDDEFTDEQKILKLLSMS